MRVRRWLHFVAGYGALGVLVAIAVVWLQPDLLTPAAPEIGVEESSDPRAGAFRPSGPISYADAVERAAPAVVNIFTAKRVTERDLSPLFDDPIFRRFFGDPPQQRERTQTSLGSGVIISEQGYVVTNHHVIDEADEIQMMLADGREVRAEVVGMDPETDLAVLLIHADDLPVITFAPDDEARVGDVVLAIGNPFGVGQTVTQGIISATGRDQLGLSTFENFIQTDAAINPGNSGGALVDASGRLVGINTAIFSRTGGHQGIGFAIPASLAMDVMRDLIEHGRVVRGWIGVQAQTLTEALARSFGLDIPGGVVLTGIMRGGPADLAGLRPGDIIVRVGKSDIANVQELLQAVSGHEPGAAVPVHGFRDNEPLEIEVVMGQRPEQMRQPRQPQR